MQDDKRQHILRILENSQTTPKEALQMINRSATKLGRISLNEVFPAILSTGFPTLDKYKAFKKAGELILLGAQSSIGKSSFALQVATHVAKTSNVYYASYEMGRAAIYGRLLSIVTNRSLGNLEKGDVPKDIVQKGVEDIEELGLHIYDSKPMATGMELANKVLQQHSETPFDLVVVDYLQNMPSSPGQSTYQAILENNKHLLMLAQKLNRPVLTIVSLNDDSVRAGKSMKSGGKIPDYRPKATDIAGCKAVLYDCDVCILLSRDEHFEPGMRQGEADIGVVKNRNGRTGWEVFRWAAASAQFRDPAVRIT